MLKKITSIVTAAQAGWIAAGCKTGCIIDDETEAIHGCWVHHTRLTELANKNLEATS